MKPETVVIEDGVEVIDVIRSLAEFQPARRGIAQILTPNEEVIGFVALVGNPEKIPLPIADPKRRTVEVRKIEEWLADRGYSPVGATWTRERSKFPPLNEASRPWTLKLRASA